MRGTRTLRRRLAAGLALVLAAAVLWSGPAPAQPAPANPPAQTAPAQTAPAETATKSTTAQLRDLVDTLKDDAKRDKLVAELELMLAAQEKAAAPAAKPGAGARVMSAVSARIDTISRYLVGGASAVIDAPKVIDRVRTQLASPETRNRWLAVAWKVALALAAAAIAGAIVRLALGRPRRALEARTTGHVWIRIVYLATWVVLDLAPVAAFVAAGYLVLPLISPSPATRLVALALINAIALARAVAVLAQAVFLPSLPGLRVVPMRDEDASYAYVWVRRLANVAIYGWMLAEAGLLLGLDPSAYDALVKLVGLVVALLVVVLILQTRHSVARWLAGRPEADRPYRSWGGIRARLADVWHVIAILYAGGMYAVWALEIQDGFTYVGRASLLTVVILLAARIAAQAVRRGLNRVFAISEELRRRYPGLEARANRYLAVMQAIAVGLVYLAAAFAILASWGLDTIAWIDSDAGRLVTARAILIAGIVVGAVFAWELVSAVIERALSRRDTTVRMTQRARTLLPLARTTTGVVLTALAGLTILSELGVNIGPLLAGAGVIGLAVGFGSQTLVKDLVTGIFILSEDQIAVGDVVTAGGHSGLVESLTIRTVRLRSLDGNVHIIPYSEVTAVENFTKDFSRYVFEVGVAYREDVDEVAEVLKAIGAEMQADETFGPKIINPLEVLGVDSFGDNAVVIKARITTLPIEQWTVGREFNRRMKKRFDELGIEIPFPHRTIYFGIDKQGDAPPARVRLNRTDALPAPGKAEGEGGAEGEDTGTEAGAASRTTPASGDAG